MKSHSTLSGLSALSVSVCSLSLSLSAFRFTLHPPVPLVCNPPSSIFLGSFFRFSSFSVLCFNLAEGHIPYAYLAESDGTSGPRQTCLHDNRHVPFLSEPETRCSPEPCHGALVKSSCDFTEGSPDPSVCRRTAGHLWSHSA